MVAFWPWGDKSSSTADFEKTLSTLSTKIADTQAALDKTRASSRRAQVIWTLYLSFAYLVYAIVLLLVLGYNNLGAFEWGGLTGGPVLIYVTRTTLAAYYNFRIETLSNRLKDYQQERAKTIQKLKDATKYDSTMELIEKYGGAEGKGKGKKKDGEKDDDEKPNKQRHYGTVSGATGRTRLPPPPTANIQRPHSSPQPGSPIPTSTPMEPGAEFAPNAEFTEHPPPFMPGTPQPPLSVSGYSSYSAGPPETHWYDRIFDVLLGEDETAPKNRIVLICKSCRLVNGQAPPGTKALSEIGQWRCMSCGALNGEMDEGKRIMNEVLGAAKEAGTDKESDLASEKGEPPMIDVTGVKEEDDDDSPVPGIKKRRSRGKK
ncbi:Protein lunapark [Fusarium austroafricanum]|uniref:Endoplasmic reticulum junction formation protein lunapark n=1 Tax=Fusarium austroafricanum TaxID=2364996 RepID=A0A8H4P0Z4_9HYPO|nr:Protein lunapark [Fusarium austroafricanum]